MSKDEFNEMFKDRNPDYVYWNETKRRLRWNDDLASMEEALDEGWEDWGHPESLYAPIKERSE